MIQQRFRVLFFGHFCIAAMLSSCAAPLQPPIVRVQAAPPELAREAAATLSAGGENAPVLALDENISESIESFDGDGTVGAYKMRYVLNFRLGENAPQQIALEQVVPSSESRYLASRIAREDAVARLRRDALRQMRYILARQNP